jgi:hypothetical protein
LVPRVREQSAVGAFGTPHGKREQQVCTFGTMTAELLALRDWLTAHGVTDVAMESTGMYWAGICPGQHESAGKHTNGKPRKGNRWLRTTLTEAALAAIRVKDSRLAARYRRIMRHRGHKKAVVAVAHTILVIVYHMLAQQSSYQELGAAYLDHRDREQATRRYIKQLERLGHRVHP